MVEEKGGRKRYQNVYSEANIHGQPSYLCPSSSSASTVEPPNRGHFGTAAFVLSSEVVLFSEVV